jgi:hypothetical protein
MPQAVVRALVLRLALGARELLVNIATQVEMVPQAAAMIVALVAAVALLALMEMEILALALNKGRGLVVLVMPGKAALAAKAVVAAALETNSAVATGAAAAVDLQELLAARAAQADHTAAVAVEVVTIKGQRPAIKE